MYPCTSHIAITDFFNNHMLVTRDAATLLMEKVRESPCDKVEVDFSSIDFISRSFADEFHKEKVLLWDCGLKEVQAINMHNDVYNMFKSVASTQDGVVRNYIYHPFLKFESRRSLRDYLVSI